MVDVVSDRIALNEREGQLESLARHWSIADFGVLGSLLLNYCFLDHIIDGSEMRLLVLVC